MKYLKYIIIGITFLSSCQLLKKSDPYERLEHFRLCNKTKEVKHISNPYAYVMDIRIASKRQFDGDTLKIEMTAKSLQEGQDFEISAQVLARGDCMDYYLELTDTEKLRMSTIEVLVIEILYEGKRQCFIRHQNEGDYISDKGKVLRGLQVCE